MAFKPVKYATWLDCAEAHRKYLSEYSSLAPITIDYYFQNQHAVLGALESHGKTTLPWKIGEKEIRWLLFDYFEGQDFALKTRKGYITCLNKLMQAYDNYAITKMGLRWGQDTRPTVDWLNEDQVNRLLQLPKTPLQNLGVNLMLCMGMRRSEVLTLTLKRIHLDDEYIEVVGKGPSGGKWRNIPTHRDTAAVIEDYLSARADLIDYAKKRDRCYKEPRTLVITSPRSGLPASYDEDGWGWDKTFIHTLKKSLGFSFSNHTLRRTFGRMMYEAGADIVDIKDIYGHDSIDITIKYIGIRMNTMRIAMGKSPFSMSSTTPVEITRSMSTDSMRIAMGKSPFSMGPAMIESTV